MRSFIDKGEVMFNPLSYFLSCEDKSRRDEFEGANWYMPPDGLVLTNVETKQNIIFNGGFASQIDSNRVFIFCASIEFSELLYKKFGSIGCVEILDLEKFKRLIRSQVKHRMLSIKNKECLVGEVSYYNPELPSGTRYACPDQIIMSKRICYSYEKEFRIAFAQDKNAFAVDKPQYSLTRNFLSHSVEARGKKLILGNLSTITKVIR